MKKSYTFVLNFGYAESARLGFVPFTSSNKFSNAREALQDLAEFFKAKFIEQEFVETKQCCLNTKEKDSEAEFCSKCRKSLAAFEFDGEIFVEWLVQMGDCDQDNFSANFIEWNEEDPSWQSNGLEGTKNQRFVYQAQWVLGAAVGYSHQGQKTFENICSERTSEKRESFSYY